MEAENEEWVGKGRGGGDRIHPGESVLCARGVRNIRSTMFSLSLFLLFYSSLSILLLFESG